MFRKALTILTVAASVTAVSAQFPWETGVGDYSPSEEAPSEGASSSEYEYNASLPEGSEEVTPEAFEAEAKEEAAPAKAKKSKAAKPAKERTARTAAPGFKLQKSCPVCNSAKLKKNLYVGHNGKRIHVCSAACKSRVRRNPDAFIKILQDRKENTEG